MNFESIQSAMDKMIEEIKKPDPPIPMILADQSSLPSSYPYGVYKILELNQDSFGSASRRIESIDSAHYKETSRITQSISLNVQFLHDSSIATCWELSEKAMSWFDSKEGMIECESFSITPVLISPKIQDQTVLTASLTYEYRTSFDIIFKLRKYSEKQGESTASAPTVEYQEEA
ncbi:phage neck terminator protein [Leptospira yasudae]|uniref:phage neck terminator protein n=1 Tax=Leptospira yasudae TaxID=2202201 RepID=UPI0010913700|nr:hypothetical protein [Leptospira yasudae]TGM97127.1 hypothetical protein EHR10_15335 [Leptospira yasudae]